MSGDIRKSLGGKLRSPLIFTDHHESHAASAFFPSPFDEAAILTLDGVGEWSTTTMGLGSREHDHARAASAVPALARSAVFGVHLLLRVQGQQRRIQVDGAGAVRQAEVSRSDHETSDRHQGRRQLLARHAVLQLLPGADDDQRAVPRAVRRPAARAGVESRTAAHGSGGEHPVGDRRNLPEDGRVHSSRDRFEESRAGRRRGA